MAVFNLDLGMMAVCGCICNGEKNGEVLCECVHLHMLLFIFLLSCCLSALFMQFTAF